MFHNCCLFHATSPTIMYTGYSSDLMYTGALHFKHPLTEDRKWWLLMQPDRIGNKAERPPRCGDGVARRHVCYEYAQLKSLVARERLKSTRPIGVVRSVYLPAALDSFVISPCQKYTGPCVSKNIFRRLGLWAPKHFAVCIFVPLISWIQWPQSEVMLIV